MTEGAPLLELRGVSKAFGAVQALNKVNLSFRRERSPRWSATTAPASPSPIKTISGLWEPSEGQILWEGSPVHFHSPNDAEAIGITTIYQDLALCDNLDIVQNMFLGHETLRLGLLDESAMEIEARKTLADLHVTTVRSIRQPVASLSGGQRQSVAVAKAVMSAGQARDHGRAHRGAGRGADAHGARPDQSALEPGHRRHGRLTQPERRLRRWPTRSPSSTWAGWWPRDRRRTSTPRWSSTT